MVQLSIQAVNNRNLFSNHYLENLIRKNDEWRSNDHKAVFDEIKKIYDSEKPFLEDLNESQLEERFFRRIFKVMLPDFAVQAVTESQDFPDYAFFEDTNALDATHLDKGGRSFYQNAFAVGEVKRWGINLDRPGKGKHVKNLDPSFQVWVYLHETEPEWGVLSNGRLWRLYHQDKLMDSYYEVDLVTILAKGDIDAFKYFYYFFRREAFFPSQKGTIFLENVLRGSEDYATKIGEKLKENVYCAMKILADGFFRHPANGLDRNDEKARLEVQSTTMRLLYRFLFLLYAEGKGLLSGRAYRKSSYSFYSIKNAIREEQDSRNVIHEKGTRYWAELQGIFGMINAGDETLGIPAYNGGLFDSERNPNLLKWQIGDLYLADAIDLLSRSDVGNGGKRLGFVDYSSLDIRHLGSIYEGLLEYRLRVAEADMVATGGKKREWASLEDFNSSRKRKKNFSDFDLFDRVKKDELYLSTDKGERKVTGSYYTPDYIVNYIVKNTIDPVVDERWQKAKERNESMIDATLSVKVLDPAMGSGHFLVGALEHLSARLMEAVTIDEASGKIPDDERGRYTPEWAKREVAAHCIYGVDLNYLAVELAKVSLWLKTIAMDKPLSFLDHRLKCGNSLIGAKMLDVGYHPSQLKSEERMRRQPSSMGRFMERLVEKIHELEKISDDNIEDIKKKEIIFEEYKDIAKRVTELANLHTAVYFGNEIPHTKLPKEKSPEDVYQDIVWEVPGNEARWRRKTNKVWFREAQQIAEDKSFFHWELEFPDVFVGAGKVKENPGWDCVIGNPPYVRQEQLSPNKDYFKLNYEVYHGIADLYVYFFERAHNLLKRCGLFGFISSNKFIRAKYGVSLRRFLLKSVFLKQIVDFGDLPVFHGATTYPCIIITQNESRKGRATVFVPVKSLNFDLLDNVVKLSGTLSMEEDFREHNWSLANADERKILDKIEISSYPLREYTQIMPKRGILTGLNEAFIINEVTRDKLIKEDSKSAEIIKPFLIGDDIGRYEIDYKGKYLIWTYVGVPIEKYPAVFNHLKRFQEKLEKRWDKGNFWWELRACEYYKDFDKPKIIYLVFQVKPAFYFDSDGFYCNNAVWIIPNDDKFLLSLLNSKLGWYLISKNCTQIQNGYQLIWDYLKNVPIRRINFTTPPEERTALVESLKSRYDANEFDKIIQLVEECLPKDAEGNFVTDEEKSDVVHDLLAFLAERMIEMNKEENAEMKGFLEWFEREIGAKIETLTNKTKLKQYHDLDFDELLDILKKNKKKIPVNLSNRELQGNLKEGFEGSMRKLKPMIERIERTDNFVHIQ